MNIIVDEVKSFLKSVSNIYKEIRNEIQIFCPYCGDAFRKSNPKWGHLYISKDTGMFFCHRCNETGTILKLLNDLNFKNESILNEYRRYFNIQTTLHKAVSRNIFTKNSTELFPKYKLQQSIVKYVNEFTYFFRRTGIYDINELMYYRINFSTDNILFYNNEYQLIMKRSIHKSNRYKKFSKQFYRIGTSDNNILIAEGPFDIINIDKYLCYDGYMKFAIGGKNYVKSLLEISKYFHIKSLVIAIDSDIKQEEFKKYLVNFLAKKNIFFDNLQIIKNIYGDDYGSDFIRG